MGVVTGRVGLIKPSEDDFKQVQDLNNNSDKLDKSIGMVWVADGTLPEVQYNGALFKELTSLREFVLKTDGLGGYTKVENGPNYAGVIRHYSKVFSTAGAMTALAQNWNTVPNTSQAWTPDRDSWAAARFIVDWTSAATGATQNYAFRIQGHTMSQTGPDRRAVSTRNGTTSGTYIHELKAGVEFTYVLGFFNESQQNSQLINMTWYIDTPAILVAS